MIASIISFVINPGLLISSDRIGLIPHLLSAGSIIYLRTLLACFLSFESSFPIGLIIKAFFMAISPL